MAACNIRIVLVRPRGAANVGAVARGMKNMGLRELVLVAPRLREIRPARAMAVHAADVLAAARVVPTLDAAVADCGLVVATTSRVGAGRVGRSPRALAPRIVAAAAARPVALVFGPEHHGLTNADLRACHQVLTIPADAAYPSLNLAQAVMVCAYELFQAAAAAGIPEPGPALAPAGEVQRALARLQEALVTIGFLHRDNPERIMAAFRDIFGRAGLDGREVRILFGLARQIEWYGRGGWRRVRAAG